MSPELRAELTRKYEERQAAKRAAMAPKPRKKAKRRKKAAKKAGIKTFKELTMRLALKRHGKPRVKSFSLR